LSIGVGTWIFSPIKFQADMGILLTFMFFVNMIGALVGIPALVELLGTPRKVRQASAAAREAASEAASEIVTQEDESSSVAVGQPSLVQ
jgi:uncharacterized membrane protein YdfJ with MMPL/SSD domain